MYGLIASSIPESKCKGIYSQLLRKQNQSLPEGLTTAKPCIFRPWENSETLTDFSQFIYTVDAGETDAPPMDKCVGLVMSVYLVTDMPCISLSSRSSATVITCMESGTSPRSGPSSRGATSSRTPPSKSSSLQGVSLNDFVIAYQYLWSNF